MPLMDPGSQQTTDVRLEAVSAPSAVPRSLPARTTEEPSAVRRADLSLRLSERKVLLYAVDVVALCVALLVTVSLRMGFDFGWRTIAARPLWFVYLAALWTVCAPLVGVYDLRNAARVPSAITTVTAAGLLVGGLYLFTPYITPTLLWSRLTAFAFIAAILAALAVERAAYARLLVQPTFRHRVLVVGAGWAGRTLIEAVRTHAATEYEPVGFVDDDPAKRADLIEGLPVLGTSQDLVALARDRGVSEVIVAVTRHETLAAALVQALMDCHERGVQVTMMQAVYERLTGKVPVEYAGKSLHLVLPSDRDPNRLYLVVKRGADLVIGLVGTLVTLVLLPGIALAIRVEGRGPVFYPQVRVGRGGRLFTLIKFRTMVPEAEARGPMWAQEEDTRVTRVGRVLRRLHLDELPQAINLVRGEMSFIGPRPERPEFVSELQAVIPFYRARHAARPGITGWAQVNYRYGRSIEDALVKLQYDLYYIKHCSLFLDAVILVRTVGRVLTGRGL
jgi:exopolysaccharide biosynthesis polyprenyl glycosylphosphotransferase